VTVPRGDLATELYRALGDGVETIYGDEISALEQRADGVRVGFAHAAPRTFELVVGADGLHSAVRRIAFGPEQQFEHDLGCSVAAFEVAGYQPRDPDVYLMHLEVGKQVARFSLRGDRTMFLFIWRDDGPAAPSRGDSDRRAELRARFAGGGWECPQILAAMDQATDVYFDHMSQIQMPRWSDRRIALVGDAAYCPTLLAGEGSALAMAGAYVLAGELAAAAGDHTLAFRRYEELLRPMIEAKQRGAERFLSSFAPPSRRSLFFQTRITRLLGWSWLGERLARRWLDPIQLPDYAVGASAGHRRAGA
jgi:2-polyprenyl-6-methoxyphenol hydroxylase-like FAD-dependent oxidoreductase